MTESEMHEKMMEYDKEQTGEENPEEKPMALWLKALTYVAYIVIPFIVIYIIYLVRVGSFKKEEKNR